jgi:hypothetical protein
MSSGVFGTVRPANITIAQDVEILYTYMPSRGETDPIFQGFNFLDAEECLKPITSVDDKSVVINGLYRLRLPLDKFNKKGIYTLYIRPKERATKIIDVSVLAAYPDVRGVVLNIKDESLNGLTDLTGYRLEFGGNKSRIIKSCNRCEPVIINTGDGYPKATRYNLTDSSSNYVFCTVTPSVAPSFRPNARPYIGEPGIDVKVVNTSFTPQMITIELVEHDIETLSYMLEGDQTNDRDNAIITTYNDKHEIYHQSDYYVLKDSLGTPKYNVRKKRDIIDPNQNYDNIID